MGGKKYKQPKQSKPTTNAKRERTPKQQQTQQTVPKQLLCRRCRCFGCGCDCECPLPHAPSDGIKNRNGKVEVKEATDEETTTTMNTCVCVLVCDTRTLSLACSLAVLLSQNAWPAAQLNNQNKVSRRSRSKAFVGLACFCRRAFQTFYQSVKNI